MLQSRGITDLLAAEKKAQVLIEEARKRKNKRLKDAQTEAKTEVDQIKGDRDQQYKQIENQQLGDRTQMTEEANRTTEEQIASLKTQYDSTKDTLLDRVVELVCDIEPKWHINVRIE